jgi:hypothetical protein
LVMADTTRTQAAARFLPRGFWQNAFVSGSGGLFCLGGCELSKGHAEHAPAPPRSRTHTTHCWQPPAAVPPQEDQEGAQELPDNTERLPLST